MPAAVAKRIFDKKVLWFSRMDEAFVSKVSCELSAQTSSAKARNARRCGVSSRVVFPARINNLCAVTVVLISHLVSLASRRCTRLTSRPSTRTRAST